MPKSKTKGPQGKRGGRKQGMKATKKPKKLGGSQKSSGVPSAKTGANRKFDSAAKEKHGPYNKVLMANPKRSFGRNKRHGNPDLSDADSLPSDSDNESDSDLDVQKKKKQKTKKGGEDSDSDVDQFLNEEEDEKKVEESSDEEDDDTEPNEIVNQASGVRVTTKMVSEWRTALKVRFGCLID
jgi:hypothetical protein